MPPLQVSPSPCHPTPPSPRVASASRHIASPFATRRVASVVSRRVPLCHALCHVSRPLCHVSRPPSPRIASPFATRRIPLPPLPRVTSHRIAPSSRVASPCCVALVTRRYCHLVRPFFFLFHLLTLPFSPMYMIPRADPFVPHCPCCIVSCPPLPHVALCPPSPRVASVALASSPLSRYAAATWCIFSSLFFFIC